MTLTLVLILREASEKITCGIEMPRFVAKVLVREGLFVYCQKKARSQLICAKKRGVFYV